MPVVGPSGRSPDMFWRLNLTRAKPEATHKPSQSLCEGLAPPPGRPGPELRAREDGRLSCVSLGRGPRLRWRRPGSGWNLAEPEARGHRGQQNRLTLPPDRTLWNKGIRRALVRWPSAVQGDAGVSQVGASVSHALPEATSAPGCHTMLSQRR